MVEREVENRQSGRADPVRRGLLLGGAALAATALGTGAGAAKPSGQPNEMIAGKRLQNKTAIVTGCARGIGRAIAVALASQGANVVGIDIAGPVSPVPPYPPATREELAETGRQVQGLGASWLEIVADIRDAAALRDAAAKANGEFGRIDILVADAGIQTFQPLLEMDEQHWHDVIDVNLHGSWNTMRAVIPYMARQRYGRIIFIASGQGRHGMRDGSSYSASKWAIIGLMKSAALELGEYNITVNSVEPGLVDTPMTLREPDKEYLIPRLRRKMLFPSLL
jgi:NAD(P)-dependent dehydrogenase (short-subunit alcohol dehydrogenase family)